MLTFSHTASFPSSDCVVVELVWLHT